MTIPAPEGILIVEDFIDTDTCRMLMDHASRQIPEQGHVYDTVRTNAQQIVSTLNPEARDCQVVSVDGVKTELDGIFLKLLTEQVEPSYEARVEWWEEPLCFRYGAGGQYALHSDADGMVRHDDGTVEWHRSVDRDVSVLIYLNDDFTGGQLRFRFQDFVVQPRPGLLVAFPSSRQFLHHVIPLESGVRYVIASFATMTGTQRVQDNPPSSAIFMKEALAAIHVE